MKIKIIDLLNKIANGEDVPKKIIFGFRPWEFKTLCDGFVTYYNENLGMNLFESYVLDDCTLNKEVEIIEDTKENKKIEKLKYYDYLDKSKIIDKINEIIDKLNEGDK